MELKPFWSDIYPKPPLSLSEHPPTEVDFAVIGSGYTGLSAARALARSGASVVVLERETIGWGASSRNGGITGCGLKAGLQTIFKRYGEAAGRQFWQASLEALDLVRELVEEDGIDCDFQQNGDLCVAYKPSHFHAFQTEMDWHRQHLGHQLQLVLPEALRQEIGSDAYYGGLLDPHGAGLHPAKLVFGLAAAAARNGAMLCEHSAVSRVERTPKDFRLHTQKGSLSARHIIAATNGYTNGAVPGLPARVIPVGSYSIVTAPLTPEQQAQISPRGRVFWDSKWFLNYFRLTPDGRLLWGGRNNLSTDLDLEESRRTLQEQMLRAFPQLEDVPVTHSWSGQLGLTFDLMPHIGEINGVHYALGFGGHGLHTALYLGRELADLLTGKKTRSPFAEIPHPTYFFHRRNPWFLPLAVQFYRLRDLIS